MLFNNKIQVDKRQQKMYIKARSIIDKKVNGSEDQQLFEEGQILLHESLTNKPTGIANSRRRLNARRSKAKKNITEKLFKESFFSTYMDSLLLDEDFKDIHESNLYNLFDETLNSLIEEGYTSWDIIKNESSEFLKEMYALCEETADKTVIKNINQDSIKKIKLDDDSIINEKDKDEEVDSEDKEEIDTKLKDNKDKVTKVITDKVVDTINKEKEISDKENKQNEIINSKNKKDDEEPAEEEAPEEEEGAEEIPSKSESFNLVRNKLNRNHRLKNTSLFRSIQHNISNKYIKEKALIEDVTMNMDMIFAESIAYYTLLETMNTVGVTDMYPSDLKKLCTELILKK